MIYSNCLLFSNSKYSWNIKEENFKCFRVHYWKMFFICMNWQIYFAGGFSKNLWDSLPENYGVNMWVTGYQLIVNKGNKKKVHIRGWSKNPKIFSFEESLSFRSPKKYYPDSIFSFKWTCFIAFYETKQVNINKQYFILWFLWHIQ